VPNQDPDDIVAKLRRHLTERGYGDIEVTKHSMESPVRSPADSAIATAAVQAAREVYAQQPPAVAPMMIGTGPMHHIAGTLGIPTVSPAGVCRPESLIHAPNENVRIEDFLRTIEYTIAWIGAVAEIA
ncbi:MAG: M20/M25/M40 family metallo-hydrolase, partial [Actinomycetota bacterium]